MDGIGQRTAGWRAVLAGDRCKRSLMNSVRDQSVAVLRSWAHHGNASRIVKLTPILEWQQRLRRLQCRKANRILTMA